MLTNTSSEVCTVMNIALQNSYLQSVVTDEVTVSWWRDLARAGSLLRFWFLCKLLLSKKITNFLAQFSITIKLSKRMWLISRAIIPIGSCFPSFLRLEHSYSRIQDLKAGFSAINKLNSQTEMSSRKSPLDEVEAVHLPPHLCHDLENTFIAQIIPQTVHPDKQTLERALR